MGKVIREFKVSLASTVLRHVSDMAEQEVQQILTLMPKGTKWIRTTEEPVTGTFVQFNIEFEHPLFEDGTKIHIEYERDVYTLDGKIIETNVLTGIKYFKPNSEPRY
jgi:hypothetical protein